MTRPALRAAARKGPCDPVGFSSIAKKPTSVSSLSASATATLTGAVGASSPALAVCSGRDRGGDRGFFACEREVAAHHALHFRELADGAGDEVGFARSAARRLSFCRRRSVERFRRRGLRCVRRVRAGCRVWRGRRCPSVARRGIRASSSCPRPRKTWRRRGARAGTRSLPATMVLPPSVAHVRDDHELVRELAGRGVVEREVFLVRADGGADLLRDVENGSSNWPISATGHSTRPATSSSRPSSSISSSLARGRVVSRRAGSWPCARGGSSTTFALQLCDVIVEAADFDRCRP